MFKHPTGNTPKTVVILGTGPTRQDYLNILASDFPDGLNADEVWGINNTTNFARVDVSFIMDDYAITVGHHKTLQDVYERGDHPIITSAPRKECPTAVAYPLGEVLGMDGQRAFLNHTAAYMIAYAAWLGVEEIVLFGVDYISAEKSYVASNKLADLPPRYLGCASYWLGFCAARGINVIVTPNSPLLDSDYLEQQQLYGYLVKPVLRRGPDKPDEES